MVLLKSKDLVHWTSNIVNIQKKYPAQENLKRVWAPQTVYDKEAGKYMVYWSMKHGNGADIIYYAYANKDFTDLEGEPKPCFFLKMASHVSTEISSIKMDCIICFYKDRRRWKRHQEKRLPSPLTSGTMDGIRGIQTAERKEAVERFEYLSA